jgi:alkylation response protein AidB-like acyl-CoA dehydrogenase
MKGEMLACFGLTEPQAGSDAAAIKTRARRHGNRWVLNGTKQFISSGKNAQIAIVFAVTDPRTRQEGHKRFPRADRRPGFKVAGSSTSSAGAPPTLRSSFSTTSS